jgi:cholesterol oxidase
MIAIADELGATYRDNPLRTLKRLVTVHPLGGCPMGRHEQEGVVDAWGEAFNYPGLYVADGAAIPGPVGPNPSLTIAALADRMALRMLEGRAPHWQRPGRPAPAPPAEPGPAQAATSLEFTEEMKGYVTRGELDYQRGYEQGKADGSFLMFHLTIAADDVDRFISDRARLAEAAGWVQSEQLGGRLPVEHGRFNLFVDDEDPSRTWMRYRLFLAGPGGRRLTLSGFKDVRDDPGLDLWSDTSTLYTRILEGHIDADEEAEAEVVASGILRIHLTDFARQLTTFRARGPTVGAEAKAFADFGRLFLGRLWDIYAPAATAGAGADG